MPAELDTNNCIRMGMLILCSTRVPIRMLEYLQRSLFTPFERWRCDGHGQRDRNSDVGAHKVHKVQHGLSAQISITASVNLLNKNANSKGSTHDTLMNRSNAINDSALRLNIDGALHSSHIRSIADVIHCFHLNHEWERPNRRKKKKKKQKNERTITIERNERDTIAISSGGSEWAEWQVAT